MQSYEPDNEVKAAIEESLRYAEPERDLRLVKWDENGLRACQCGREPMHAPGQCPRPPRQPIMDYKNSTFDKPVFFPLKDEQCPGSSP